MHSLTYSVCKLQSASKRGVLSALHLRIWEPVCESVVLDLGGKFFLVIKLYKEIISKQKDCLIMQSEIQSALERRIMRRSLPNRLCLQLSFYYRAVLYLKIHSPEWLRFQGTRST